MQNHRNLVVWRKAHALALGVHHATKLLSRGDAAGIVAQARRASLSIPSNVAEGCSRPSDRDFGKFLQIAIASASELDYHLEFITDARLLPARETRRLREQVVEVRRMLYGLLKRVREPAREPRAYDSDGERRAGKQGTETDSSRPVADT